jgi:DNA-binding PadR family transcriptional regulator
VSVRYALLALLQEGPKYGLQLRQEFEAGTGEAWPLNVGQVYTTLQRLERDGLVEAEEAGDGPQRTFRLTHDGAAELDTWLRTPPAMTSPPRDELVIKVLIALRLRAVAVDLDVVELLQVHRRQLVELMQQYTRLKEDADDGDLSLLLVVDAELFRIDALVRWVDAVEARLRRLPAGEVVPTAAASRPAPVSTPQRLRRRRAARTR